MECLEVGNELLEGGYWGAGKWAMGCWQVGNGYVLKI